MTQPTEPPPQPSPAHAAADAGRQTPVRAIDSDALLGGAQELQIQHRGTLYRLRLTSLGKLILTK